MYLRANGCNFDLSPPEKSLNNRTLKSLTLSTFFFFFWPNHLLCNSRSVFQVNLLPVLCPDRVSVA